MSHGKLRIVGGSHGNLSPLWLPSFCAFMSLKDCGLHFTAAACILLPLPALTFWTVFITLVAGCPPYILAVATGNHRRCGFACRQVTSNMSIISTGGCTHAASQVEKHFLFDRHLFPSPACLDINQRFQHVGIRAARVWFLAASQAGFESAPSLDVLRNSGDRYFESEQPPESPSCAKAGVLSSSRASASHR